MNEPIDKFDGEYRFLSNFAPFSVTWLDEVYPTAEHLYQAMKSESIEMRNNIRKLESPAKAKRMGSRTRLRPMWEDIRCGIMFSIVQAKFHQHHFLQTRLLNTGHLELIEGNTWGDTYWGVCDGVGENRLGKILMEVREECYKKINGESL